MGPKGDYERSGLEGDCEGGCGATGGQEAWHAGGEEEPELRSWQWKWRREESKRNNRF